MAECVRLVCDGCCHAIEAWSDGNPPACKAGRFAPDSEFFCIS